MKIYKDSDGHLWVEAYAYSPDPTMNPARHYAYPDGLVCVTQFELVRYIIAAGIEPQPQAAIEEAGYGPLTLISEVAP